MAQRINFTVIGEQTIHCAGCEQRIGNALRRLDGVEAVSASVQTQQVTVDVDPQQVRPEEVQSRLERLGYDVVQGGD